MTTPRTHYLKIWSGASACTLLILLLLLSLASKAVAQTPTAAVNGTVRDATGATVPNAAVLLEQVSTRVRRESVTNESGLYAFPSLAPGQYTIEVTGRGFGSRKSEPITLTVNQTATLDFTLQLGAVEQSVSVQAVATEVQASTAELGAVIQTDRITALPLNGRNFTQLLALTPGISRISVSQNAGGASTSVGDVIMPSVNGQNNRSNLFLIDGINNQGTYFGAYAVGPIVDTIQEFKVQSHNDEAVFGSVMGGIVNVVTKSGTNDLHGALWEFLRNDAFDASNFFSHTVFPFKQNQFGASGGGPVTIPGIYSGKNRTFFYLGYQGFRFRTPSNVYARVPTPANLQGDLSDWPRQIFDPFSTVPDPNQAGQFNRTPFAGNRIPATRISNLATQFAKFAIPAPVVTPFQNFNAWNTDTFRRTQNEYTARVDHSIGGKDFLWFRWSGVLQSVNAGQSLNTIAQRNDNTARNIGASWSHTFGPSSVLQVAFGRVKVSDEVFVDYKNAPADVGQQLGFSNLWVGNWKTGLGVGPSIAVADYFSALSNRNITQPTDLWEWKADASKIRGNHIIKFGGGLTQNGVRVSNQLAQSSYGVSETWNPLSPGTTGSGLASFLLDAPGSAQRRNVLVTTRWGGVMGLYLTDQWKVTPKLTFNIGLRYDRTFIPPYGRPGDKNIHIGNLDLLRGVYILQYKPDSCAVTRIAPCIPTPDGSLPANVILDPRGKLVRDTTKNLQPRVGLAYRLDSKTAIRSSFGIFFDNWAGVTQRATNTQGSWPSVDFLTGPLNAPTQSVTPNRRGTNPFPEGGTIPAPNPFSIGANYFDPFIENPYSIQWNFGIQRQFGASMLATLNYVGSGSRRLGIGTQFNVSRTPGPGDPRDRFPFPYINPSVFDRSWGTSSYNGLQMLVEKRFARGLAYTISYTWSKSLDAGCSGWFQVEGCWVQDPYNWKADRSVAGFDLTQVLTTNFVYEMPFGKGKLIQTGNRIADYLIGPWQVNGIAEFSSGQPFTMNVSGDIANTRNAGRGGGYMRLHQIGNPKLSNPNPNVAWFNTAAFAIPAPFTFGSLGRNTMRSDWIRKADVSLFRIFPIMEGKRLEFRAEAFNVTNTPVFSVPVADRANVNFGRALGTRFSPRQIQLGLKIVF
ncbi:MAG: TonB-dependent receptor [Acidobacteria bacterium]|nr:TonB-dependent receptor [Acidobacteriota bacterium]